jgi:hypothetical protein
MLASARYGLSYDESKRSGANPHQHSVELSTPQRLRPVLSIIGHGYLALICVTIILPP